MSIRWYITPYDPKHWEDPEDTSEKPTSDLYVDPEIFYHYVAEHQVEIVYYTGSKTPTTYKVTSSDGFFVRINLYHKNQIFSLTNNPIPPFFNFILLYRAFIPTTYRLYFFNSSSWESLELRLATTRQDIREFMGYKD